MAHPIPLFLVGVAAGTLGALLGLGGGAVIVPCLALIPYFHITMHEAIAASIVGVLMTSLGGSARYIDEGFTDIKLGMLLALGTTTGAVLGSLASHAIRDNVLEMMFSAILVYASYEMIRRQPATDTASGNYRHYSAGIMLTGISGVVAGMLGVGGGAINVPVMHLIMDVPVKVTAATSNFMIGATASAAVLVYLLRGSINFSIAVPVGLGVFIGAKLGASQLKRIDPALLKRLFAAVLLVIAAEMLYQAMKVYL
ncbi:MAG: sulfite exporter TauE/SafE family protein [Deltaproteobacteria bacterium]|nr:sulfite exporter TauE/SafE family protein [Deltaproteobacteria bacterium]